MSHEIETRFAASRMRDTSVSVDHSAWHHVLVDHVVAAADGLNRVDYAGLKARSLGRLSAYIQSLEATDVSQIGWREQFAFWANLYNALTVKVVADHFPVVSIRDIRLGGTFVAAVTGGPWKAKLTTISGITLSLDDIEHTILRGQFKDPRLHYAINCGSVGCPNLRIEPFTGANLEVALDTAARDFINRPRGVAIQNERLVLSGIFKWYRRDFGGDERLVLRHIAEFADPARRAAIEAGLRVDRYDYDWRLNGVES
jgi:Protein of unknown function, DUF547